MDRKCSLIQSLILEIIAVSGEVLKSDLMNISEFKNKYIKQTICDLKKDNLIKESTIDNMKTLRLASKGKMFLIQLYHERYNDLFSGGRQSNKVRSSPQRRKRALNLAQVIILLRQTDVKIFRDEKLLLYDDYCPCADGVDSEFYTSMELKELFVEFNIYSGSCTRCNDCNDERTFKIALYMRPKVRLAVYKRREKQKEAIKGCPY